MGKPQRGLALYTSIDAGSRPQAGIRGPHGRSSRRSGSVSLIDRLGAGPLSRSSPGSRAEQAARSAKKTPSYSPHLHPSIELRILAPLPTTTPESARLCALSLGSIVFPATAHQWSGLVARFTSRCTSLISQALPVLDGGCAHGTLGCAGFDVITGLLTCAQPPPFRLVARGLRPN